MVIQQSVSDVLNSESLWNHIHFCDQQREFVSDTAPKFLQVDSPYIITPWTTACKWAHNVPVS